MSTQQTILVAEDEPGIRKVISETLKSAGYRILTASNGNEALAWIESERVDLAIIDLMLPKVDGWKLCHKLKSSRRYSSVRVIILSALVGEDDSGGAMDECDFMMKKPFNRKVLRQKVDELMKPRGLK